MQSRAGGMPVLANTGIPPARLCIALLMQTSRMVMTGKGMTDQQRIGLVGI